MAQRGFRFAIGCALVAAAAVAVAQAGPEFTDKGDNMKVLGIGGQTMEELAGGVYKFVFVGKDDRPVKGVWKKQNLTVLTARIVCTARASAGGKLELQKALMSGGITATCGRHSANKRSSSQLVVVATGQSATYVAGSERLDLAGGVKVVSTDPGAGRRVAMSGKSAWVALGPNFTRKGEFAVSTSSLNGPIVMSLDSTVVDQQSRITYRSHLDGQADHVNYDQVGDIQTWKLLGSVKLTRREWGQNGDGSPVKEAERTENFAGSAATVVDASDPARPAQAIVKSAQVQGPVTFSMEGRRRKSADKIDPKTHKPLIDPLTLKPIVEVSWVPYRVSGSADWLTYTALETPDKQGATSVITLKGHVEVQETQMGAKISQMDEASLWLDEQGNVVHASASGSPAKMEADPHKIGIAPEGTVERWAAPWGTGVPPVNVAYNPRSNHGGVDKARRTEGRERCRARLARALRPSRRFMAECAESSLVSHEPERVA